MPTVFTHAVIGLGASVLKPGRGFDEKRVIVTAMALSMLPDVDALFRAWIPYSHPFGHRGFTHSLFFAAVVGLTVAYLFRRAGWLGERPFLPLAILFGLVTASHGFFDAMTDGGLGIAFFAPFDNTRYFLPWRPIPVAPLSARRLMTAGGLDLMLHEGALFWTFAAAALLWNRSFWKGNQLWRIAVASLCLMGGISAWIGVML